MNQIKIELIKDIDQSAKVKSVTYTIYGSNPVHRHLFPPWFTLILFDAQGTQDCAIKSMINV